MKEGRLIAFEGIDGCGKSTQLNLLARFLDEKGIEAVVTREPGGTALGKEIRRILLHTSPGPAPKAELLLYMADRAQHVEEVIRPALATGKVVLTDRFHLSTLAYQCHGRGLSQEVFRMVTRWSLDGLKPHLTLLFDLPVSEIPSRLAGEKDRLESEDEVFFERVRRGFLDEARRDETVVVLDATLPEDLLHFKVVKLVSPLVEIF